MPLRACTASSILAAVQAYSFLGLAVAVAAAQCATAGLTWAQAAHTARLSVQAEGPSDTCVNADAIGQNVERRLARKVFVTATADLEITVQVRPGVNANQVVTVHTRTAQGTSGERILNIVADSCEALLEPIALVVTLTIDPAAPLGTQAPPTATKAPPPPPALQTTSKASPPARAEHNFLASIGAGVLLGPLPPTAAVEARAAWSPPRWPRLGLFLRAGLPTQIDVQTQAQARFVAASGGLQACPQVAAGQRLRLGACAGVELSWVRARGLGFDEGGQSTRWLPMPVVALEAQAHLTATNFIYARLQVGWAPGQSTYQFIDQADQAQPIFTPSMFSGVLTLGLGWN